MFLSLIQSILRPVFGAFEKEEFKKYLRMGLTFTFIIGSYWTLRTLKNSLFCNLVGPSSIPYGKTLSLIVLIPLVILYTKLIDKLSHKKAFYVLSGVYAFLTILFSILLMSPIGQASNELICSRTGLLHYGTQALGYLWYVFVESYGSLVIALFWAIASSTTMPNSAKKGFSLVVAIGQIGGIVGPYFISGLPHKLGLQTNSLSVMLCGALITFSILSLRQFFDKTPNELLKSFTNEDKKESIKKEEPGFFEGLKLLISKKYLLGIFGVISFFEMIIVVFDMHFQTLASTQMQGTQLAQYMGAYGSWVNIIAFLCLIAGIGNITRILGVGVALLLMPIIYAGAITGFLTFDSLNFLFVLMVGSKAINYALNNPALKQLYIPTSDDARFKSQAWIETFGSRGAKEAGSIFNMTLGPLQSKFGEALGRSKHVIYSGYLGYSIVAIWFVVALFLGRTYKKSVKEGKTIC